MVFSATAIVHHIGLVVPLVIPHIGLVVHHVGLVELLTALHVWWQIVDYTAASLISLTQNHGHAARMEEVLIVKVSCL